MGGPAKGVVAALFLLSMVLYTTPVTAQSGTAASPQSPSQSPSSIVKKRNPAFAISVETVVDKLKGNQALTLIDVRGKDRFEAASIPGSLTIPLYAIKTKTYLKSEPLILINEGYEYEPLERECALLRNAGFKAWILNGGLYGWKYRGGSLRGDPFEHQGLNKVPAPIFFTEKAYEDWLIIDVSPAKRSKASSLIPQSIHIPYAKNTASFASALKKAIAQRKNNPLLSLILFNENGEGYEAIEEFLHKAGYAEVFFLTGGLEAYTRFVTNLALIRQARDDAKKTIKKCINCP